jgi:hypothetical protein
MGSVNSNGSTATFNGASLSGLQSIQVQRGGQDIENSDLNSTRNETEGGLEDITVTLAFNKTNHSLERNDEGDFAATYQDGGSESINDLRVASVDNNAQKNSPLASTVTLKPCPATTP